MNEKQAKLGRFAVATLAILAVAVGLSGRASDHVRISLVTDWTHRHVVFSTPQTFEQALRVQRDPRYVQQWVRRHVHPSLPGGAPANDATAAGPQAFAGGGISGDVQKGSRGDWSVSLGAGASMNANAFPAKFSFDVNSASCSSDYVVFTTKLAGAAALSIVGFNNLYAGTGGACTGPTVMFAYHTRTNGGTTSTSPVLSFDGTQIAYVEGGGGTAALHILRPVSGQGTIAGPAAVGTASVTGAAYATCKAGAGSCLLSLTFSGAREDTGSAPFVDYDTDTLYVGDNIGRMHKFTGVFQGTPAEVTSAGWPIALFAAGVAMTSPVYDSSSNNIYAGGSNGRLRFVRETGSTVGTCVSGVPPCVGAKLINTGSSTVPINDGPIVDSTNNTVFVFVGTNGDAIPRAGVFQAPTTLAGEVEAFVGPTAHNPLYSGTFDNNYLEGANPSLGFLYVCGVGNSSGTANGAVLYRIGFNNAGTMKNSTDGNALDLSANLTNPTCSPGTEIFNSNNSTDLMFFSVQNNGAPASCGGGGCVMSFNVTSGFPSGIAVAAPATGGTSGIVIDNTVPSGTTGQASSIYYITLANQACGIGSPPNGGCAVKLTQANLN
jgi:hypothetical protein